jgi:hypothetical protein
MRIKDTPKALDCEELKGLPNDIFLAEIDPNDSISEELVNMTEDERAELIIKWYQDIKYYKAGLRYLKERIQKK